MVSRLKLPYTGLLISPLDIIIGKLITNNITVIYTTGPQWALFLECGPRTVEVANPCIKPLSITCYQLRLEPVLIKCKSEVRPFRRNHSFRLHSIPNYFLQSIMLVNRFGQQHVDYEQCRQGTDSSARVLTSPMSHPSLQRRISHRAMVWVSQETLPTPSGLGSAYHLPRQCKRSLICNSIH